MKYDRIYLVDDEPLVNAIQSLMIRKHFSETELVNFNTSTEALKTITEADDANEGVVLLLDLNMPVLDAIDFLKELDKNNLSVYPDIYIITASANQKELDFVRKHRLVKDVIFKPLNDETIKALKVTLEG
ncbi:response regulator [Christiangramia aquimixticola]|uniref:response regulator n=1 Tax=Christiangramia aquimixticola TaxID=1697558 RepID=UPI003AA8BBCD